MEVLRCQVVSLVFAPSAVFAQDNWNNGGLFPGGSVYSDFLRCDRFSNSLEPTAAITGDRQTDRRADYIYYVLCNIIVT